MTKRVELIAIGDDVGFILPDDILAQLGVGRGDTLSAEEGDDGSILLTSDRFGRQQEQQGD